MLEKRILPRHGPAPEWETIQPGIELAQVAQQDPPLAVYCIRIDTHFPTISFYVSPDNGVRPLETDGLKTSSFLKNYDLEAAINASPFHPVNTIEGSGREIHGISASDGKIYSAQHAGYGAFVVYEDRSAAIVEQPFDLQRVEQAVSGFRIILDHGTNIGTADSRHPRSAIGISEDNRYVFLLAADGRQASYSIGMTTEEAAAWLSFFGAHNGLNLDGGGSTTLVIRDHSGNPTIVNRPIHRLVPNEERVVGNHLGIYAGTLCMDFFCQ
jgi:exopolysaccharide biosynthesis protein